MAVRSKRTVPSHAGDIRAPATDTAARLDACLERPATGCAMLRDKSNIKSKHRVSASETAPQATRHNRAARQNEK